MRVSFVVEAKTRVAGFQGEDDCEGKNTAGGGGGGLRPNSDINL